MIRRRRLADVSQSRQVNFSARFRSLSRRAGCSPSSASLPRPTCAIRRRPANTTAVGGSRATRSRGRCSVKVVRSAMCSFLRRDQRLFPFVRASADSAANDSGSAREGYFQRADNGFVRMPARTRRLSAPICRFCKQNHRFKADSHPGSSCRALSGRLSWQGSLLIRCLGSRFVVIEDREKLGCILVGHGTLVVVPRLFYLIRR